MIRRVFYLIAEEVYYSRVTLLLAGSYLGIFLAMVWYQGNLVNGTAIISFWSLSIDTLVDFGAVQGTLLADGEYWRLITATFLHGSIPHVVLNTFALYQLGRIIEDWYGGSVLLFLHLVLGVAGSLVSFWFHRLMPRVVQVGGSGALFGIAAFLLIAAMFEDEEDSPQLFRSLALWLGVGFLMGYLLGADNFAHAGGAVAGAAIGTLDMYLRRDYLRKWIAYKIGISSLLVFLGAFALCGASLPDRMAQREAAREEIETKRQAQRQNAVKLYAAVQMKQIVQHALNSLLTDEPMPLVNRDHRMAQLRQLADEIDDHDLKDRLERVINLLNVPEEEYLSRPHLTRILEEIRPDLLDDVEGALRGIKPTDIPLPTLPKRQRP